MNHLIAKVMFFLTGGQSGFAFQLSHSWHGVDLYLPLVLAGMIASIVAVICLGMGMARWYNAKRKAATIAFIAALALTTAAYAASSTLANLSAVGSISDTDLFYDNALGAANSDYRASALQVANYVLGKGPITPACATTVSNSGTLPLTLGSAESVVTRASGNYATTDCGKLINYNDASDASPTLPTAASMGSGYFDTCALNHAQTLTRSGSDTITVSGSAGTTYSLTACVKLVSDGASNWNVLFIPSSGSGPGGSSGQVQTNNGSGGFNGITNAALTALVNAATASLSGALPAWPNNTTTFFRGDGSYAALPATTVNGQTCTPGSSCTVPAGSVAGYISGNWYPSLGIGNPPAGSALVASTVYCHPYVVGAQGFTVRGLGVDASVGVSGNLSLALYKSDGAGGRPSTLIDTTGDIPTTAATGAYSANLGATHALTAGVYWVCSTVDNTTIVMQAAPIGGSGGIPAIIGSASITSILNNGSNINGLTCTAASTCGGSFAAWSGSTFAWSSLSGATFAENTTNKMPDIAAQVN